MTSVFYAAYHEDVHESGVGGLEPLKILIPYIEEYCLARSGRGPFDIQDFSRWLVARANGPKGSAHAAQRRSAAHGETRVSVAHLLLQWSRIARYYVKKGLEGSTLVTPEDYEYLHYLQHVASMTKSELILIHNMEMPSGIEIIKRLLKKGLAEELEDPDDKRSHRVRITKKGTRELQRLLDRSLKIFDFMVRPLSDAQAGTVMEILSSLVAFHEQVFKKVKNSSLAEFQDAIAEDDTRGT